MVHSCRRWTALGHLYSVLVCLFPAAARFLLSQLLRPATFCHFGQWYGKTYVCGPLPCAKRDADVLQRTEKRYNFCPLVSESAATLKVTHGKTLGKTDARLPECKRAERALASGVVATTDAPTWNGYISGRSGKLSASGGPRPVWQSTTQI